MKWLGLLIIIYPILYVIDLINGSNWRNDYFSFISEWWVHVLLAFICWKVYQANKYFKYHMLEDMRENEFFTEHLRYNDTPFVSPILLMYMKTPPTAIMPTDYAYLNDTFYRTVVNLFRDRVYILASHDSTEPTKRPSYLRVIGWKNLSVCALYYGLPVVWALYVFIGLNKSLLYDWPVITLPLLLASWQRGLYMLQAFVSYLPSTLDKKLEMHDVHHMKVSWRDAFPDRDVGETFVRAYYVEKERRARYFYTLKNIPIPKVLSEWENINFPPYPYPSPNIPSWENEYEPLLEKQVKKQVEESIKTTNNVVEFRR